MRDRLVQVDADAKLLEASTETLFQFLLQLLVVIVVKHSSRITVTEGLETVFFAEKV